MGIINIRAQARMISSRQIKAARALLGWTQTDLAKACGLHLNAINKIEKGQGEARPSTLERIKISCETAGVRFRGQRGVELKDEVFEVARFEGADFLRRLTDDALLFLRGPEDGLLFCVVDEQLFNEADYKENQRYYRYMEKRGFFEKCLTTKATKNFINKDRSVYRWLPEKVLGTVAYGVYGNRVAFIQWKTREVLVVKSDSLAATFRGQFEFMWSQAKAFD